MIQFSSTSQRFAKILFLFSVIMYSLASCQTFSLYRFQSLNAPSVVIPPDVKTIGFVNRNTNFTVDSVSQYYIFNNDLFHDTTDYSRNIALNCHIGFSENISELVNDSIPFIQLEKKEIQGDREYKPMKWEEVDSICESTGSDVLICLEDVQIFNKYTVVDDEEYYGITDVNYFAVWRIYDPLFQTYIDERVIVDSLFSEIESSSYKVLVEKKLPKRRDLFKDVAYEIGNQYANLLSPEWMDITRKYFSSGDDRLSVARYYLAQDNWESAMVLWTELANENNPKLSGRACYNMALAYELQEDFKNANHWIRKSIASYDKLKSKPLEFKMVGEYAMELIKRTKNKDTLNRFFGE